MLQNMHIGAKCAAEHPSITLLSRKKVIEHQAKQLISIVIKTIYVENYKSDEITIQS